MCCLTGKRIFLICLFFRPNINLFPWLHFPPSSLIETPKKLGSSSRRNSLSTLSVPSKLSERQLMSLQEGEGSSRPLLRRDLPVCWLDMEQNIKENILQLFYNFLILYNFVHLSSLNLKVKNISFEESGLQKNNA